MPSVSIAQGASQSVSRQSFRLLLWVRSTEVFSVYVKHLFLHVRISSFSLSIPSCLLSWVMMCSTRYTKSIGIRDSRRSKTKTWRRMFPDLSWLTRATINCPSLRHPSSGTYLQIWNILDEAHAKYLAALQALFDENKGKFGFGERTLILQ
eukprot:TRINITY_DN14706_c0_g1_i2.p2 TRINITY_DN14706_c0_g1~~TRINITY_DN14706_c0_g1_i2.p2  ORF type:complete len:151 (+),score=5.10 TRINITY_DN14706_c0_g1_i2:48-500(+)